MKMNEIGNGTDIVRPYAKAIHACKTVAELATVLEEWKEFCPDAVAQTPTLTDEQWQWALANKRRAKQAEKVCELAGAILCPLILLKIGMTAEHFCVPDGCAFIRLRDLGHLEGTP